MRQSFIKIVNEHLDDRLCLIQNKTLLIYGERDNETPLYMAKRFSRGIKNSRLVIFKNAGHFPFIDCPYKFNLEVREFLLSE
jgi:pimeloyl-ACP methyl ester carboxylesterase